MLIVPLQGDTMIKYMKPFNVNDAPNTLIIGNGLNRAFNNVEWDVLLKNMSVDIEAKEWSLIKNLPYPLMAVVVTKDHLKTKLREQAKIMLESQAVEEQKKILRGLVGRKYDAIITTNYTYEIEQALISDFKIEMSKSCKWRHKTCKDKSRNETEKLYQYMYIDEMELPIWHIHGEAAKPDTMVIGHYYYGKLLAVVEKYAAEAIRRYKIAVKTGSEFYPRSWVDYILFGNVSIIGQGLDFSEMELWWLINCKKRNGVGVIKFYEPQLSVEKRLLCDAYGVETIESGLRDNDFKTYYKNLCNL